MLQALVTTKHCPKNRSSFSDSLVWVHLTFGNEALFVSEIFGHHFLNLGNSCRTANQNDVVDVRLLELGIFQHSINRTEGFSKEIVIELFKACSS